MERGPSTDDGSLRHPFAELSTIAASRLAMTVAMSAVLAACSSPTSPTETVLLEGELSALGSVSHVLALPSSGVTTITVLDLRKLIWDVTLGDVDPSLSLGIGRPGADECEVTGRVVVREDDVYLWSLQEGSHCFVLSDPGSIPVDGVLSYSSSTGSTRLTGEAAG